MSLGIVKVCHVNVHGDIPVVKCRRFDLHLAEHIDICLKDIFSERITDHVKALAKGFGGGNRIRYSQGILVIVRIIHHLTDGFILGLALTEHPDIGQKNVTVFDLLLQVLI